MDNVAAQIKERLNIVEIAQEYLQLKKMGTNFKALCPFHHEKTPSFMVSEQKQIFHCFGCGKGGDVFTFIQEIEGVEFAEALRMLAKKANVELRPFSSRPGASSGSGSFSASQAEHNERTALLDCLQLAAQYFHRLLQNDQTPAVQRARDYLRERGVQTETIKQFQLGYSLEAWDALFNHLRQQMVSQKVIEQAGLIIRSTKTASFYDRFRGRLIFPIHNHYGNVIGFGGRTLDPHAREAKYINSPQTVVYNKSAVLYGLHLAKTYIQKMNAAVIMEGYLDVITAHQAKFRNVVAASGTALTSDQIRLLKRYSTNLIFAFDGDTAGRSATWRGMQTAIQEGLNVKVLILPPGQDPDEVIRHDAADFRRRAVSALPFMEYAFDTVLASLDLTQAHHKKQAAAELLPMIAIFPDKIEQSHYLQILASKLNVNVAILQEKLAQIIQKKWQAEQHYASHNVAQASAGAQPSATSSRRPVTRPSPTIKLDKLTQTCQLLSAIILQQPADFPVAANELKLEMVASGPLRDLYKIFLNHYNQFDKLDPQQIAIEDLTTKAKLQELELLGEEKFGHLDTSQKQQELWSLVRHVKLLWLKSQLAQLQAKIAQAEQSNDLPELSALLKLHQQFLEQRLKLE